MHSRYVAFYGKRGRHESLTINHSRCFSFDACNVRRLVEGGKASGVDARPHAKVLRAIPERKLRLV